MQNVVENPIEENAYCFEKRLSSIISQADSVKILQVNREEEFAPIIYEKGVNSLQDSALAVSNLHKKWISFPSNYY